MIEMGCDTVRELIPDMVGARLGGTEAARVAAHVETCDECRAEADLARLLFAARPHPPTSLADRIRSAARADRGSMRRPWWGLAAAAIAVIALGIGVASHGGQSTPATVPGYVAEGSAGSSATWLGDDGSVAGAPALDGLSNDALQTLLDELGNGGTGGTA